MKPDEVGSGTPLVYWKRSPGASTGCSPTTPSPRTSCLRPVPSVMIQCRVLSCTVSVPELVMTIVYDQKYCCRSGDERSGRKFGSTVTSIWRVTARYMQTVFHNSHDHHSENRLRNKRCPLRVQHGQPRFQHDSGLERVAPGHPDNLQLMVRCGLW